MTARTTARPAPAACRAPLRALLLTLALALAPQPHGASAQPAATINAANAIESISANQQGANVIVKIALTNPPDKLPIGFAITNPPRVALDLGATVNGTGQTTQEFNVGDLRSVNVVQAGGRSRLVFNLKRSLNYATAIDGNAIILTIDGSGGAACLLYTSPSPRDATLSRMPSSA